LCLPRDLGQRLDVFDPCSCTCGQCVGYTCRRSPMRSFWATLARCMEALGRLVGYTCALFGPTWVLLGHCLDSLKLILGDLGSCPPIHTLLRIAVRVTLAESIALDTGWCMVYVCKAIEPSRALKHPCASHAKQANERGLWNDTILISLFHVRLRIGSARKTHIGLVVWQNVIGSIFQPWPARHAFGQWWPCRLRRCGVP
jgi:hypothetical protein